MKKINRPLELDAIPVHRREDCVHYEACLNEASALLWPSFSCDGCALFNEKSVETYAYDKTSCALAWDC